MVSRFVFAAAAAFVVFTLPAPAVPINPGDSFVIDDEFGSGSAGVTLATNPEFGMPPVETVTASATRIEDGFDGLEVVEGLYNVQVSVTQEVILGPSGVIFAMSFDTDTGFSPGPGNGQASLSFTGFAGWDVDIEYLTSDAPIYPYLVALSGDGDTLSFSGFDLVTFPTGTFYISTNAPTYALVGGGAAGIAVDTFGVEDVAWNMALAAPAQVPLPLGGALLITGLGGLAVLRGRRPARRASTSG